MSLPAKSLSVLLVVERSSEPEAVLDRLELEESIELAICTSNGISKAAEAEPNVIVFDMEGLNGRCFEIAKVIRRNHPRARLMFIGAESGDRSIQDALDVGAQAYLTKQEPPGAVVTAIGEIARGRAVFSGPVRNRLVVNLEDSSSHESRKSLLTRRELEIVRYISKGLSDREIAILAKISSKTVEAHCSHIRNKLGVRGRVDIARFAFREGLTSI